MPMHRQPPRCPRHALGNKVEESDNRDTNHSGQLRGITVDPLLLERRSHRDKQQLGPAVSATMDGTSADRKYPSRIPAICNPTKRRRSTAPLRAPCPASHRACRPTFPRGPQPPALQASDRCRSGCIAAASQGATALHSSPLPSANSSRRPLRFAQHGRRSSSVIEFALAINSRVGCRRRIRSTTVSTATSNGMTSNCKPKNAMRSCRSPVGTGKVTPAPDAESRAVRAPAACPPRWILGNA